MNFKRAILILVAVLGSASQACAGIVYAAYTALAGAPFPPAYGIVEFDAQTLQPIRFFNTTSLATGLSYFDGSLYDVESGNLYQRNPITGAQINEFSTPGTSIVSSGVVNISQLGANYLAVASQYTATGTAGYGFLANNSIGPIASLFPLTATNFTYATGATNGFLYGTDGTRLIKSDPNFDPSFHHITFAGNPVVHIGQMVYNPVANLVETAANINFPSESGNLPISGIYSFDPITENPTTTGFPGIMLTSEPSGVAYGFNNLYASSQSTLYQFQAANGATKNSISFNPLGINTALGQLLFIPGLLGDFNFDNHVDSKDIAVMMSALANPSEYLANTGLSQADLIAIGDLNDDSQFNNADLQAFLNYLQAGNGSTAPVPEPSTFVLGVLAFGLLLRYLARAADTWPSLPSSLKAAILAIVGLAKE